MVVRRTAEEASSARSLELRQAWEAEKSEAVAAARAVALQHLQAEVAKARRQVEEELRAEMGAIKRNAELAHSTELATSRRQALTARALGRAARCCSARRCVSS